LNNLSETDLYITFEEFQEWLSRYDFVRKMIREALMPQIWSLTDKYVKKESTEE
jgi:hypothetical protein